jgi:hypothetical protein
MPGDDQHDPGEVEAAGDQVAIESVDGNVIRANQRLCNESFVENAVGQSQEKQADDGKAPMESELTNDDKGKAVGKKLQSRGTGIQKDVRRCVPGHDFGEHGRDGRECEKGAAAGCWT